MREKFYVKNTGKIYTEWQMKTICEFLTGCDSGDNDTFAEWSEEFERQKVFKTCYASEELLNRAVSQRNAVVAARIYRKIHNASLRESLDAAHDLIEKERR